MLHEAFASVSSRLQSGICVATVTSSKRFIKYRPLVPTVEKSRRRETHGKEYGYFWNYHSEDQRLPRLDNTIDPVRVPAGVKPKVQPKTINDPWESKNALMGQNDYIDILGNGDVHPAQLLYHVPRWLRGFPGSQRANELVKLIHYRNRYEEKLRKNMPKKWHELVKNINYLLMYHNYHKSDEIRLERKLGLWDEKPDYTHKERWNEKWMKSFKDYYH